MTTEADWFRLLDLMESRRPQFEDLLSTATKMVERIFLCPANTPSVDDNELFASLSSAVPCTSSSPTEANMSLMSPPQLPLNRTGTEPVGLQLSITNKCAGMPSRGQDRSTLTLEEPVFLDNVLHSDGVEGDMAGSVLPTPDWNSAFGFSAS